MNGGALGREVTEQPTRICASAMGIYYVPPLTDPLQR